MSSTSIAARAASSAPRPHLRHVEGLRALAALVVYVNHAYAQAGYPGRDAAESGWSWFAYSLVAGHLSVTVFIVVSGFCLALPVVASEGELSGGARSFFRRRARRILPPYFGAVALCLALIFTILGRPTGTLWDVPIQVTPVAIASHLLLVQDLFATGSINYVFWSIAVEWQIYFFFPLLVICARRLGIRATVVAALLVGYALRIGFGSTRLARANPHYLGMFTLGMLAAYVARSPLPSYERLRAKLPWGWIAALAAACATAMSLAWGVALSTDRFFLLDLPTGIFAACILMGTSRPSAVLLTRVLSFRPLVLIGTFSYSLYLIHAPVLQLLWQFVLHPAGLGSEAMFALLMSAGLVVVLAAAYLFFRVFEQPFMRAARASAARPREASTAAAA